MTNASDVTPDLKAHRVTPGLIGGLEAFSLRRFFHIISFMDKNDVTSYATYIMSNPANSVLYVGMTNDLNRRVLEHKSKLNAECFTAKYNVCKLVYFEKFQFVNDAIKREKQLKGWNRLWKNQLISKMNPEWNDLFAGEL